MDHLGGACPRLRGQPTQLTRRGTTMSLSDQPEDGAPVLDQAAGLPVEAVLRICRGPEGDNSGLLI